MDIILARVFWATEQYKPLVSLPAAVQTAEKISALRLFDIPLTEEMANKLVTGCYLPQQWFAEKSLSSVRFSGIIWALNSESGHVHQDDKWSTLFQSLPIITERKLLEPQSSRQFFTHVSVLHEFNTLRANKLSAGRLLAFHTAYKMLFLAHSQPAYRKLGPFMAKVKQASCLETFADRYQEMFMTLLKISSSIENNTNSLMHMQGYFREKVSDELRQQLTEAILAYRRRQCSLDVVFVLFHQLLKQSPHPWLLSQRYLYPWFTDIAKLTDLISFQE